LQIFKDDGERLLNYFLKSIFFS